MKIIYSSSFIPQKLYHSTFKAYLPSIQKKGIIPHGNICNWEGCQKGVYLANDPDLAYSFTEVAEDAIERGVPEEYFEDIIVLEINTNKIDKNKLSFDPHTIWENEEEEKTFIYRDIIPPYAISNIL